MSEHKGMDLVSEQQNAAWRSRGRNWELKLKQPVVVPELQLHLVTSNEAAAVGGRADPESWSNLSVTILYTGIICKNFQSNTEEM